MKISLLNHNFINNNFKQTNTSTIDMGQLTGVNSSVDTFVKAKFEERKQERINSLSYVIYDKFTKSYNQKIKDIEKFKHPYNKALMLQKLAQSYRTEGDVERAGIILAKSFNILNNNLGYWEDDKKKLIENPDNFKILKDFFYCSNNTKAKYFVMKSINDLNNPKFLPIAEDICEQDTDVTTSNSTRTIIEAKKLINKHSLFIDFSGHDFSSPNMTTILTTLKQIDRMSLDQFENDRVIDFTDMLYITWLK